MDGSNGNIYRKIFNRKDSDMIMNIFGRFCFHLTRLYT